MSAGNNLPTDTEVLFFALKIVQRAETAAEAKVWAQEVLRFQRRQHRGRRLAAARRGRVARQELEAGAALRANGEGVQERVGVLGARVDLPRHQSSGAARGNVMIWCRTTSTRTW